METLRAAKAAGPQEERWLEADAGRFWKRFEAVWPHDWRQPRDVDKARFLNDPGPTASVRLRPMQKMPPPLRVQVHRVYFSRYS